MKKKFSEITLHKQVDNTYAAGGCIIELEGCSPSLMSFSLFGEKINKCITKEFNRLPVGSSLRIMVLTEEREVNHD